MNKRLKKNLIRGAAGILFVTILAIVILPFSKVFAEDAYNISLDFTDGSVNGNVVTYTIGNVDVTAIVNNNYTLTNGVVSIGNESWLTAITIDDNYDANTMQIRVYAQDGFQTTYSYNNGVLTRNGDGGLPNSIKFVIEAKGSNQGGPEPGEGFDGRAVVLWSCGSGDTGVCYHEFSVVDPANCDFDDPTPACDPEIGDFNDGTSTFFKDTNITADNKPDTTFNVHATYLGWYTTDEFYNWQGLYKIANGIEPDAEINWDMMNRELILGDPKDGNEFGPLEDAVNENHYCATNESMEDCVNRYSAEVNHEIWTHKLQPVGEPTENNAFVSYGDRNFKVVIYNDDYKGVTTTADFGGLNFYPISWGDPFLRTDQYDVSDTNEVNPTFLQSILLEDTVNLDVLPYNNYQLESIEALDVPDNAVTINKVNNRKFQIVFSSNFYDHVIFRLTDTNGDESYVQIKRYTIDGYIAHDMDNEGRPVLTADFYFDRTKSHNDFDITAKIVYNDGTIENVTLEAANGFRDGLGNPIDGYEADQEAGIGPFNGKGLSLSQFVYPLEQDADRNIKDVYFNAEYKGGDAYTYAGAYAGSGEGTPANIYHPQEGE